MGQRCCESFQKGQGQLKSMGCAYIILLRSMRRFSVSHRIVMHSCGLEHLLSGQQSAEIKDLLS